MYKNIIPHLVTLETKLNKIKGFYFSEVPSIYGSVSKRNLFHYKVLINNDITIPNDYDFRNGHYYKKGNVWFYKRRIGFFTLKFCFDTEHRIFSFNRIYSYIPFEVGHIYPPGRHLADMIVLELFLKGFVFIRGCAARYKGKNFAFVAPSYNGKTSLIEYIIDHRGKFISEDFIILNLKNKNIYPTPCTNSEERQVNKRLIMKLSPLNIITKICKIYRFILYTNQPTLIYKLRSTFFDFIFLRSMFFFRVIS